MDWRDDFAQMFGGPVRGARLTGKAVQNVRKLLEPPPRYSTIRDRQGRRVRESGEAVQGPWGKWHLSSLDRRALNEDRWMRRDVRKPITRDDLETLISRRGSDIHGLPPEDKRLVRARAAVDKRHIFGTQHPMGTERLAGVIQELERQRRVAYRTHPGRGGR